MENLDKTIQRIISRAEHSQRIYNMNVVLIILLIVMLATLFVFGSYQGTEVSGSVDGNTLIFFLVGSGIVRVGAVAVGVYGIQIMFNLARYHMRLSQHLLSTADALELTGGDIEKMDILLKAITPIELDFGKSPASPTEKMSGLVKDLITKIPSPKP
ncbi:hypothetical protein [uncultured Paraglaciecola sp.]|uniref:hypothetical protein n=1 Tax=uncultured Paraglaciecola sp. TaxID=1765024 RepID=UPI002615975B|nr:hypothetical protein [uncultured Paraglaciecola sp.]